MNLYSGHIDITPSLSEHEAQQLLLYLHVLKEYRQSGQKYALAQFIGLPIDSRQTYALFTAYSPAIQLQRNKITFLGEYTEKSHLKPCLNAMLYFFLQEQILVKLLDIKEFNKHQLNGKIQGRNDKGDTWSYEIQNNIFYNVLDNGELFLKDRFKKEYFKPWEDVATLREHTQHYSESQKFKI